MRVARLLIDYKATRDEKVREPIREQLIEALRDRGSLGTKGEETEHAGPFVVALQFLVTARSLPPDLYDLCLEGIPLFAGDDVVNASYLFSAFFVERGDPRRAAECMALGIPSAKNPIQAVDMRVLRARHLRRQGRWEEGSELVDEALFLASDIEGPVASQLMGLALGERTEILIGQGALIRADAALKAEQDFIWDADASARPTLHTRALLHEVSYLFGTARYNEARRRLEEALADAPGLEHGDYGGALLGMRGIALGELARYNRTATRSQVFAKADEFLAKAVEHPTLTSLERLRTELARFEYAMLDGRRGDAFEFLSGAIERSAGFSMDGIEYGALLTASEARMALVEHEGSESEKESLQSLDKRSRKSFEAFLSSWKDARADRDLAYLRTNQRREVVASRIALSLHLRGEEGPEEALSDLLRVQGLGSIARSARLPATTIRDVREGLLEESHGVLSYLPASLGGYVFAFDRDAVVVEELGVGHELDWACRELRNALLAVPDTDSGDALGRRIEDAIEDLSDIALPPSIADRVANWERVTIVGSEYLYIPVECLRDPTSTEKASRWLGEVRAVDRLPSMPVGLALANRPAPRGKGRMVLVVAEDPGPAARKGRSKLMKLPVSKGHIEELTAPYAKRSTVYRHMTKPRLNEVDFEGAELIHFMSHGLYSESVEEAGPALVMEPSDEGSALLRAEDVRGMKLSGVALLSACEAGLGPVYWGNDQSGDLGTAFLEAGCTAAVQTWARVRFKDARAFAERVTRSVAKGASPAEAARDARAALAGKKAGTLERARWAQFGVLGLGQR